MRPERPNPYGQLGMRAGANRLRLQTLVRLRWLAVLGQTATVLAIHIGLGFELPIGLCLLLIAASAWFNVILRARYPASKRIRNSTAAAMLAYDVLQLAGLLYLTGGLQNPFAFLMLAPVTVSAATLPWRITVLLGALAIACASALTLLHLPLPWFAGESLTLPLFYVVGLWAALICGILFIGHYAWRISDEARRMADALAVTELALAHEQQLSALDGLAAAAAHKLGTPLSTIAVVAKELLNSFRTDDPHRDDVALLRSEAARCREILAELSRRGQDPDFIMSRLTLTHLLDEVLEPHRALGVPITLQAASPDVQEPIWWRNPGVVYGLGNLVENAVDFAKSAVSVEAFWNDRSVTVTIMDDGPGFGGGMIDQLGEPFVTTRPASPRDMDRDGHIGMGLGFFIAKTLLERSGALIGLKNRIGLPTGAVVTVVWPRARVDFAETVENHGDAAAIKLTSSHAGLGAR